MSRSGSWILHSCLYVCEFFKYCMSREAGSFFCSTLLTRVSPLYPLRLTSDATLCVIRRVKRLCSYLPFPRDRRPVDVLVVAVPRYPYDLLHLVGGSRPERGTSVGIESSLCASGRGGTCTLFSSRAAISYSFSTGS